MGKGSLIDFTRFRVKVVIIVELYSINSYEMCLYYTHVFNSFSVCHYTVSFHQDIYNK